MSQATVIPKASNPQGMETIAIDRRNTRRERMECDLWMVGHEGSTILRCHCDNVSGGGVHVIAPLGYGIARGQRYELRSHAPGREAAADFSYARSKWARVVHTEFVKGALGDHVGVGMELEQ